MGDRMRSKNVFRWVGGARFSRGPRLSSVLAGIFAASVFATNAHGFSIGCPILDEPHRAWREVEFRFIPRARTGPGWKRTGAHEAELRGMLFYGENDWGGDLEVRAGLDVRSLYGGDPKRSVYPLTMAHVSAQWSQRFAGGLGLRLDAAPGYYSLLGKTGSDSWAVPFGFTAVWPFDVHLAAHAGLSFFPGDRSVDPRAGIRWRYEDVLVDIAYPESRIRLRAFDRVHLQGGMEFRSWPEYGMGSDGRGPLRLTESRAWGGAEVRLGEELALGISCGYVFNRRIRFPETSARGVDVSDAALFQVGLTWLY